jgi:hypothetical protein
MTKSLVDAFVRMYPVVKWRMTVQRVCMFLYTELFQLLALSMQIILITGRWNSFMLRLLPGISLIASFSHLLRANLITSCFYQPNKFIIVSLRWYSLRCCQLKRDCAALRVNMGRWNYRSCPYLELFGEFAVCVGWLLRSPVLQDHQTALGSLTRFQVVLPNQCGVTDITH